MFSSNDSPPLKSFYPFPTFRPNIEEALDTLDKNSDKKFFIIKGRTGCGKSAIAVALSRKYQCHILTQTKVLQDQYANTKEFDAEFVIKGKSNYRCSLEDVNMSEAPCASSSLLKIGKNKGIVIESVGNVSELKSCCTAKKRCEYYEKKKLIIDGAGGFLNYDFALSAGGNSSLGMNETIVLDEAHNFVDKLLDFYSLEYSRKRLNALLHIKDAPNQTTFISWLEKIHKVALFKSENTASTKEREQLKNLKEKCRTIIDENPLPGDYYVEHTDDTITIKPLKPKQVVQKFLGRYSKVFFLSATIDDTLPSVLGLPENKTFKMEIESDFPIGNRPIIFPKDIPNINYQTKISNELPAIQVLNKILEHHDGQKGIIHTGNYRIFTALQGIYGRDQRFTWVEQGMDKSFILKAHAEAKQSILVSPSMMEGIDLHGDLARWQVIFKIPFPARTQYQEALEEQLPGLYAMTTRNAIVQAYGRPIRSIDDWATTYVLDGSLKMLIQTLDKYFVKAVKAGEWQKLISAMESNKLPKVLGSKKEG